MNKINTEDALRYLESLRKSIDPLTKEMEEFAIEKKIPILDWKSAEFLETLVRIYKPGKVLEIGTAIAYTTIKIASCLEKNSRVDTIELSKHNIPLAKSFIERSNQQNKINLIEGDAREILPSLSQDYDLVFLDADKEDYNDYYEKILPILKSGGVLVIDNLLWKGYVFSSIVDSDYKASSEVIKSINEKIISDERVFTTILPLGDGIGVCIKK